MKKLRTKRGLAVLLAGAITLGGAGAALAYFTSTGTGSGSATVGTSSGLDITQNGAVTGLLPGGPSETINYTVTNNTTSQEEVGAVTVTVASVGSGSGSSEACDPSMFPIVQGPALNTNLAPNGGNVSGTATISMTDDGNNQDNCQGQTLTLSFSSN